MLLCTAAKFGTCFILDPESSGQTLAPTTPPTCCVTMSDDKQFVVETLHVALTLGELSAGVYYYLFPARRTLEPQPQQSTTAAGTVILPEIPAMETSSASTLPKHVGSSKVFPVYIRETSSIPCGKRGLMNLSLKRLPNTLRANLWIDVLFHSFLPVRTVRDGTVRGWGWPLSELN
ncbi:hypothetical protein Pelo_8178 [Pelomyxa schiedti]|nr:hypothetical protein Pelo_8178 [Pelomyxa schiedti]